MDTKTIIAAVVGAITAFLAGWLIWGILLMDYFQSNTNQYEGLMLEKPHMWAIFIHNLANAFLYAWLFSRMGVTNFASGFQTGAIINTLISLGVAMMFYAMMNWYSGPGVIVVNVVVNAVMGGLIGGVIAMMLGRVAKPVVA